MESISYLSAAEAQQLDVDLMGPSVRYNIHQLMEVAGMSVAEAVASSFKDVAKQNHKKILVLVGPGNNGGDGLVAARYLRLFGFEANILCPKPPKKELYADLLHQAKEHGAQVFESLPDAKELSIYSLLVDSIFGFSFKGPIKPPYYEIIKNIKNTKIPILAVDVPSGWDVDQGDVKGEGLDPVVLVSLSAPKLFAKKFKGIHFLGGRFIPESLKKKYNLSLPEYPGTSGIVRLS